MLWRSAEDQPYEWHKVIVLDYLAEEDVFQIQFESGEITSTQRVFLCFDIEDPRKFIKRMSAAFQRRLYADSIIRYKFYIQAMPTEHLSELSWQSKVASALPSKLSRSLA